MTFTTVILKNLLRRPARSLLTITGIGIGIAAVVALVSISWGFERTAREIYAARGTDLIVSKVTSQTPIPPLFDQSAAAAVERLPHVDRVSANLADMIGVEEAPMVLVFGWPPGSYHWDHLRVAEGSRMTGGEGRKVLLGRLASEMLGKKVGDRVQVLTGEFVVAGIFESSSLVENSAMVMPLSAMQDVTESAGLIRHVNVRLEPGATDDQRREFTAALTNSLPGFRALSAGEFTQSNVGIQGARAMSWATSALALAVGAVGVMNTILMSVFERIHEIGVLLAIGWRRRRILKMILFESVMLSLFGGLAGIAGGLGAVRLVRLVPNVGPYVRGDTSAGLILIAMGIAVALGAVSGLYPAWRASRLQPSEALRYE